MEGIVKSASSEQKNALISTIIAAFLTDPVARWLCPDVHQYFLRMDEFVDAIGGASFTAAPTSWTATAAQRSGCRPRSSRMRKQ
jgi:hypothetical protein